MVVLLDRALKGVKSRMDGVIMVVCNSTAAQHSTAQARHAGMSYHFRHFDRHTHVQQQCGTWDRCSQEHDHGARHAQGTRPRATTKSFCWLDSPHSPQSCFHHDSCNMGAFPPLNILLIHNDDKSFVCVGFQLFCFFDVPTFVGQTAAAIARPPILRDVQSLDAELSCLQVIATVMVSSSRDSHATAARGTLRPSTC